MVVTYFFVIRCRRIGVTSVKKPTKEYAATAMGTLSRAMISLYKNGWAATPNTLEVSEKN